MALTRFLSDSKPSVNSIEEILAFDKSGYIKFVQHIVAEIEKRTEEIITLLG